VARPDTIEVEGTVIDRLRNVCRVEMPNGHIVLAHLAEDLPPNFRTLPGDKVMVEMTPYDLSKGRIICRQN
jgi:translation initiation factor IF-1